MGGGSAGWATWYGWLSSSRGAESAASWCRKRYGATSSGTHANHRKRDGRSGRWAATAKTQSTRFNTTLDHVHGLLVVQS